MRESSHALLSRLFSRVPFRPLYETIEHVLGGRPEVLLFEQKSLEGCPAPFALGTDGVAPFLVRRNTAYKLGTTLVSYHQAFVDANRLRPRTKYELSCGRLPLAEIFADPQCRKYDFVSGDEFDGRSAGGLVDLLSDSSYVHRPYLWRRYSVALDGHLAFLVAELIPLAVWSALRAEPPSDTKNSTEEPRG